MAQQDKYLAFAEEDTFGSESAKTKNYIAVRSVTPTQTKNYIDRETIAYGFLYDKEIGTESAGLSFDFDLATENGIGWLLKHLVGSPTCSNESGSAYSHVFIDDDSIGSLSFWLGAEDIDEVYTGQVIKSIEISSSSGTEFVTCSVETYGKDGEDDSTVGGASFTSIAPFKHSDLSVKVGDSTGQYTATNDISQYVSAVNVKIDNAVIEDEHTAGSAKLQNQPVHTRRRTTWEIEVTEWNSDIGTYLRDEFNGESDISLRLAWEGATITGEYKHALEFVLADCVIDTYDHPLASRDQEKHTFSGEAVYHSDIGAAVRIESTDTNSSYYEAYGA